MSVKKITYITKAAQIACLAFNYIVTIIQPGITEKQIANQLARKIKKLGGEGIAFRTIVSSGMRSAQIHGFATKKKLKIGEPILIDFGVKLGGYRSDVSRTVFLGKINKKQRKLYNIVLKAQNNAVKAIREGAKCADIDNYARKIITKYGYGKKFPHSTGHGLGYIVHDKPSLSKKSSENLAKNDIITVEPGIYLKTLWGIRIEDDYLVTKNGCKCLTDLAPKKKPIIIPVKNAKVTTRKKPQKKY